MKKSLVLGTVAVLGGLVLASQSVSADTYTVVNGDTVSEIASSHNTTVSKIKQDNNLSNVNLIYVGDKIELNGSVSTQSTTNVSNNIKSQSKATYTAPAQTSSAPSVQTTTKANTQTASQNTSNSTVSASMSGTLSASEQQAVLSQLSSRTGVSASTWNYIITRESNWQPSAQNPSSTAYGLTQNIHTHGNSVQQQIDDTVSLYNQQGLQAWAQ